MRSNTLRRTVATTLGATLLTGGIAVATAPASSAAVVQCTKYRVINSQQRVYQPLSASGSTNCNLAIGATGSGVTALQISLNRCYNAGIASDGSFGPATRNALLNVQHRLGLNSGNGGNGAYGPITASRMSFYEVMGSRGSC